MPVFCNRAKSHMTTNQKKGKRASDAPPPESAPVNGKIFSSFWEINSNYKSLNSLSLRLRLSGKSDLRISVNAK